MSRKLSPVLMIGACLFLAGCATSGPSKDPFAAKDQLESINRPIFAFNIVFDRLVMKPVNTVYDFLPEMVRTGIDNFFTNLSEPLNIVQGTLQLNPQIAFSSLTRFLFNTTIGVGGLYDFAGSKGIQYQDQNSGKTLAAWGVPSGSYFVIPFLGPSTVRGATGQVADWFVDPTNYVLNRDESIAQIAGDALTDSDEHRKVINDLYYNSLSPYEATRSAYMQHHGMVKVDPHEQEHP